MKNVIITHAGQFHADELLAIATLIKLNAVSENVEIIRTFKLDVHPTDAIVLDMGGGEFDHHYDQNKEATNCLVLEAFLKDEKLKQILKLNFYNIVSDIDRGILKATPGSFNAIVSNFNSLPNGFNLALSFTKQALEAVWKTAEDSVRLTDKYFGLEKIGNIRIQRDKEVIPNWKDLAETENVKFLICPNTRDGWNIVSQNSDKYNIPVVINQTFRHPSGFMAVYPTIEEAITHATSL